MKQLPLIKETSKGFLNWDREIKIQNSSFGHGPWIVRNVALKTYQEFGESQSKMLVRNSHFEACKM